MKRAPWSLTRRLVGPLAAILLATALLQIGLVYRAMLQEADEVFDAQLRQTALALVQGPPARVLSPRAAGIDHAEGLDLLIRERGPAGDAQTPESLALPAHLPAGFSELETPQGRVRVFTAVRDRHEVAVGQRLAARREMAREIALSALWPLGVLAAAGLVLLILVARSVLRPVAALEHQVAQRDPDALDPLTDPGLPREMLPLLVASNALIERLAQAVAEQRRFLADAAHELRTPISAIALQNTLVARADTAEERRAALAAQGAGIRRAAALVEQLLRLSRLRAADAPLAIERFDAFEELGAILDLHRPEADARHITCTVTGRTFTLHADPALFAATFGNLVGNAVRHCPAGSTVWIAADVGDAAPTITIDDDGPGIPDAELEAMLRPFHRGVGAGTPGTGLGLAIVQAACVRAGWTLVLARSARGGLRAAVSMPNMT